MWPFQSCHRRRTDERRDPYEPVNNPPRLLLTNVLFIFVFSAITTVVFVCTRVSSRPPTCVSHWRDSRAPSTYSEPFSSRRAPAVTRRLCPRSCATRWPSRAFVGGFVILPLLYCKYIKTRTGERDALRLGSIIRLERVAFVAADKI